MSEQDELFEPDLIDHIANALPVAVRAEYYRELRHCRSLPENDEMLRILRAMQFSVLLMVQVPERMASERERFEQTVTGSKEVLENRSRCAIGNGPTRQFVSGKPKVCFSVKSQGQEPRRGQTGGPTVTSQNVSLT
jgi:hypothetical protein